MSPRAPYRAEVPDDDAVAEALELAREAHDGQVRKGDGSPYVTHPVRVAEIVHAAGFEPHVVAAALLHDVVEDTDLTLEELEQRFEPAVTTLVAAMTEDKQLSPYEHRKDHHREQVEAAGPEAAAIYAADKLANLRDMRGLYAEVGEEAERRFSAPLDLRITLWRRDLEMVERLTGDHAHVAELRAELDGLERDRERRRG